MGPKHLIFPNEPELGGLTTIPPTQANPSVKEFALLNSAAKAAWLRPIASADSARGKFLSSHERSHWSGKLGHAAVSWFGGQDEFRSWRGLPPALSDASLPRFAPS